MAVRRLSGLGRGSTARHRPKRTHMSRLGRIQRQFRVYSPVQFASSSITNTTRHPAHAPNHQEQQPTHLSKHTKAHDEVTLSALPFASTHMIVCRQQRCQPRERSAQRERAWDKHWQRQYRKNEKGGRGVMRVVLLRVESNRCVSFLHRGVGMLEEMSGEYCVLERHVQFLDTSN